MKPTDDSFDRGNRTRVVTRTQRVSLAPLKLGRSFKEQPKRHITYFLTPKEVELGELARAGKANISSQGIFMYFGHINPAAQERENMLTGQVIEVKRIEAAIPAINASSKIVLKKYLENDTAFDEYLGLPFVKGMTDISTRRTMVMAGDYTHHGQAGQGYFLIGEKPYNLTDEIGFGNVVLWNNIGDFESNGFLGVDYSHNSQRNTGGAKNLGQVITLLHILKQQGVAGARQVYLLRTPYLRECPFGKFLRERKDFKTLDDYCNLKNPKAVLDSEELSDYLLSSCSQEDMYERAKLN